MAFNLNLGSVDIGMALIIVGILATVVGIYYINYLQTKGKAEKRPSLVFKTIVVSFTIIAILLIIIYLSGEKPTKWHYLGMIGIVIIIYLALWAEAQKYIMKRPEVIISEQMNYIFKLFHAEPDLSSTYGLTWPKYKVVEIPGGKIFDVESCTLIRTNIGFFLIKSNPYENIVMEHQYNPLKTTIEEIWDKATARRYDEERQDLINSLQEAKVNARAKDETGL